MDAKLSDALAKRLAAYSVTAGVVFAATSAAAQHVPVDADQTISDSDIVFYTLDPKVDIIRDRFGSYAEFFESYVMDLDSDGVHDMELIVCYHFGSYDCGRPRGFPYRVVLALPEGADAQNGFLGYYTSDLNPGSGIASRLSIGEPIGPPRTSQNFYPFAIAGEYLFINPPLGAFLGRKGYVGFRFVAGDGGLHYGWLRLGVDRWANRARIYGFAYEAVPDTPIAAGNRDAHDPDLVLDGSVNQTTFPPEGGILTFSGSVANSTDESETLDLWAVARAPGGALLAVRRFDAVTIPPGATVSVEAAAEIPNGAPAGTGEVKFHIGRYPRVFDSEVFTITKEPGAAARVGDRPFFVEETDAEAPGTAAAEVVQMHALTAPAPNPTTGRSAITLEVAEAQHVTVAVHDALGRRVALLHDGPLAAGTPHRLVFDGAALPAGVYAVRTVGEAFSDVRVLTLTR